MYAPATKNVRPSLKNLESEAIGLLAISARNWLADQALPLWWREGFDWQVGTWRESLDLQGKPTNENRRARVQGRQTFVFSILKEMGIEGPWDVLVQAGFEGIVNHYCDNEGLLKTVLSDAALPVDSATKLYDQTFVLLALASARHDLPTAHVWAQLLLSKIKDKFHILDGVGYAENCAQHPFQSNAHMHLFEAALAWAEACRADGVSGEVWEQLAAEIVDLAQQKFIDKEGGFLREFFNARWQPMEGEDGRIVEPGHQFEWAWLFVRWSQFTGNRAYFSLAESLFRAGSKGINSNSGVAVNTLNEQLIRVTDDARLWPQTEWLKAALVLFQHSRGFMRTYYLGQVDAAFTALNRYLDTPKPGLWYDRLRADGRFDHTPAPASSMYHIVVAVWQLLETSNMLAIKTVATSRGQVIEFPTKRVRAKANRNRRALKGRRRRFDSFH
ncbi:MAG: AGE family epimerase/isomerase [Rhizobiaceae bacterium]